jgi:hypothetical protein
MQAEETKVFGFPTSGLQPSAFIPSAFGVQPPRKSAIFADSRLLAHQPIPPVDPDDVSNGHYRHLVNSTA